MSCNTELLVKLYPPLNYSKVNNGIHRSAYPSNKCLPFIKTLRLKSMICLQPTDLHRDLREFCNQNSVILVEADIGINKEPFLSMNSDLINEICRLSLQLSHQPCLIFDTKGSNRVNCLIGCLRKKMNWSMSSIIREYEVFCRSDTDWNYFAVDVSFITLWKQTH